MSQVIRPSSISTGEAFGTPTVALAQLTVSLPPATTDAVSRVLEETGDTPGEMVGKALGLYMLALDARKRGKVVGAADSADALDTLFTGY